MAEPIRVTGYREAFSTLSNRDLVQAMYGECDVLMARVLLTLHGEAHARRRATELQLFRRNFTRYYAEDIYPAVLAATLAQYDGAPGMDLVEFGYRVNMNLSADFAGIDRPLNTAAETDDLLRVVRKFSEGATLFHSTRDKDEVRREVAETLDFFAERFFKPSRDRRQVLVRAFEAGDLSEDELPRDVLTVLLQHRSDPDLDAQMILREAAFFLQAAAHSTGNAMVHAFHETMAWCAAHPGDRARIQDDPNFLQRCVHESMRLHPASPAAWRTAGTDTMLPGGRKLAEGDAVLIDIEAANRDVTLFGVAVEAFNPHRQVADKVPPFGLTFGVGIHTCVGRELAAGVLPKEGEDSRAPRFPGIVTLLVQGLLDKGVVPDPAQQPEADSGTARQHWATYPVIFDENNKERI